MDNKEFDKFDGQDNFDLSSNDSEIFDLNSFATDEPEEEKPEAEPAGSGNRKNKKKKKLFSKANILKTLLTGFLIMLITGCLVAGSLIVYVFAFVDGTMEEDLENLELSYTTTIYVQDDNGAWVEYQRLHGEDNRIWVDYDKEMAMAKDPEYTGIPQNLANAFIAIEDKRFLEHDGVDWKRTIGAFVNMIFPMKSKFGGSTITQQLVKNLTADDDQKASRKVREIMRARYLEGEYTKEVILECYMNTIAMGKGMCGVEVPAEYYFGKTVSELTIAECASLAAITKSPEYYRPDKNPEHNLDRRNDVLYEMYDQKLITKEEYDEAVAEELNVVADSSALKESETNSYFVDALIDEVIETIMDVYGYEKEHASKNFYNGGYKIYSTLDPDIQSEIEKVFTDKKYALSGKDGTTLQGSMTVMDYQGHIKGLVGGIGEKTENRGLNRATMSPRQPGSTVKPLSAYAPAIENNLITYSSIVNDKKTKYGTWTPVNWYKSYWGKITVKYALERSVNTIPVQLVDQLTAQKSYDFLTQKLGFKNLTQYDVNYSPLGMGGTNGGVTTKESAAAFAVFGNNGLYYEPTTFVEVYDQYETLIASHNSQPTVAISEDTATIMNHLLQNVVYGSNGTGKEAKSYIPHMKIFAKTGTTNDANNLWFVGGSPYYVASTWCGFDTPEKISQSKIALRMWGSVMSEIHEDLPEKTFTDSKYAQCRLYCKETGLLATDACPIGGYGWYKMTNQQVCNKHEGKTLTQNTESAIKDYLDPPTSSEETTSSDGSSSDTAASDTSSAASDPASSQTTSSQAE